MTALSLAEAEALRDRAREMIDRQEHFLRCDEENPLRCPACRAVDERERLDSDLAGLRLCYACSGEPDGGHAPMDMLLRRFSDGLLRTAALYGVHRYPGHHEGCICHECPSARTPSTEAQRTAVDTPYSAPGAGVQP